ncbi:unnamed protein product [Linum trigynum]|uniref:Uncharacterized protein n=1 Tax=Linum trigynum TaxID=586398 RepID=A0AAV2FFJ5_9ROSI
MAAGNQKHRRGGIASNLPDGLLAGGVQETRDATGDRANEGHAGTEDISEIPRYDFGHAKNGGSCASKDGEVKTRSDSPSNRKWTDGHRERTRQR